MVKGSKTFMPHLHQLNITDQDTQDNQPSQLNQPYLNTLNSLNSPWLAVALALMWLHGAIASMLPAGYQMGIDLLTLAGFKMPLINCIIWGGVCADILMAIGAVFTITNGGMAKLYYRSMYALISIVLIIIYTLLASVLAPQLWFDAFGCLAKNIPIVMVNWLIYKNNK
jgi:DoxX-like family